MFRYSIASTIPLPRLDEAMRRAGHYVIVDEAATRWRDGFDRLQSFDRLKPDWYERGSVPPSPAVLSGALFFFLGLQESSDAPPPSRVSPTPYGSVVFEWLSKDGGYLAAEIETPSELDWINKPAYGPAEHWTTPTAGTVFQARAAGTPPDPGIAIGAPPPRTSATSSNSISLADVGVRAL